MPTTLIDIHPHIISRDDKRYPRSPLGGKQSDWSANRPVSLEEMIVAMDTAGVQKAAIVHASTCYGYDSSYVADAVAQYPERFTGTFCVDMMADDAPERIRYWYGRKLTGLRLFTIGSTVTTQTSWLADPKTYPGWVCCVELGIPICVQMSPDAMPQLLGMLQRFPHAKIILDHAAGTKFDDGAPYNAAKGLFDLARYPNVHIKLSERVITRATQGKATPETVFSRFVSEFGANRLAWGSNYPASQGSLSDLVALARRAFASLKQADRDWIFAKTAQSLYPALAD